MSTSTMSKFIVTTTIYQPSEALLKYISFPDWTTIIVGDMKTPHQAYFELQDKYKNVVYLSPEDQDNTYPELSKAIGWNCIQRRSIGFLEAYNRGAQVVATVDDDNIPLENWGSDILIGKEIEVDYYMTDELCFDPMVPTNYSHLWHRGFPIQLLKNKHNVTKERRTIIPDIQAGFWNGDPDIDAFCRMEHHPDCKFDRGCFPFASNKISPFNQQNTFLSRKVLEHYLAMPFVGRMDDIWPSFYVQSLGFKVVYTEASVIQKRNDHDLTKDLVNEFLGYENNVRLLTALYKDSGSFGSFLPEKANKAFSIYRGSMKLDLSIICVARNDDYGGNFLNRLFYFLRSVDRINLNAEIIIVEWNPVHNREKISNIVKGWDSIKRFKQSIKVIEVSPEQHINFIKTHNAENAPQCQEYPGKNVGMRHARGETILITNPDIFYPSSTLNKIENIYNKYPDNLVSTGFPRGKRLDIQSVDNFPDIDNSNIEALLSTVETNISAKVIKTVSNALGDFMMVNRDKAIHSKGFIEYPSAISHFEQPFVDSCTEQNSSEISVEIDIYHFDHSRHSFHVHGCPPGRKNYSEWGLRSIDLKVHYI